MKTAAWLAGGAILLFGVNGHPGFLDLQTVGLILIGRGAAGWWLGPAPSKRARRVAVLRQIIVRGAETAETLAVDLARDERARVPLDDLLGVSGRH